MKIKGWRTFSFGLIVALTSVLSSPDVQAFVSEYLPAVGGGIGGAIMFLRWLTASPIFKQ